MAPRRVSISEARRSLPALIKEVVRDGGRVDITYRGEPQVSLLRVADVKGSGGNTGARGLSPALRVELAFPADDLVEVIRELRTKQGTPRAGWLEPPARRKAKRRPKKAK